MPFVTGASTPSSQAVSIRFAELVAPAADRFVPDEHAACSHDLFDIAKAYAETKIVPHALGDDLLDRKSVV